MINEKFEELLRVQEKIKGYSFSYSNIYLLPYLRIIVGYYENIGIAKVNPEEVIKFAKNISFKEKIGMSFFFFKQYLSAKRRPANETNLLDVFDEVDVLYFSHDKHLKEVKNQKINVWTSPIDQIITNNFSLRSETIQLTDDGRQGELSRRLYNLKKKVYLKRSFKQLLSAFRMNVAAASNVNGFNEFIKALDESKLGVTFSYGEVNERIEYMIESIQFFKELLIAKKPKVVFIYSFYMEKFLAVVYAARSLNIPVVEIQHGLIRPHHFAYTHWDKVGLQNLFFLPNYCLTHDEPTAALINSTAGHHIRAFFVGNFNLIEELKKRIVNPQSTILSKENISDRHILVTTSTTEFLPEELCNTIKNDHDFVWHIKLHPRYTNELGCQQYINTFKGKNVRIYYKEDLSVFDFFELCSVHITEWSYVAIEAEALGLTNIIVGDVGRDLYSDQINQGSFFYSYTEQDIVKILSDYSIFDRKNRKAIAPELAEQRLLRFFKQEILKE
ncbi:MAG: hypothetical protein NT150_04600 [Bacteroidetes bacterium]|nr:hypothetical protein [Bacteroidota bacterium]